MPPQLKGLWQHRDFLKLWTGETISLFGSQVSFLAIPLTAVIVLQATPAQMGIMGAVEFAPFLFLSLFAGVWVDRLPRRPVLIMGDIGRTLILGSIPLMTFLGFLSIIYLYVVGLLVGIMTVFFDVAYMSYLPSLVERDQLVEGNGKLEVSRSVAQIAGPGLAGILVQAVTAPIAILVDAISFLISAIFLGTIKTKEPAKVVVVREDRNIWREIGEGLQVVLDNRLLRSIAACTGTSNLFSNMSQAIFTIFVIRELGIPPGILGFVFGAGSLGALVGALSANKSSRRFGLGHTIIGAIVIGGIGGVLVPLAGFYSMNYQRSLVIPIIMLILSGFLGSIGSVVYNINQVSLRQAITPHRLQGRMNASMRFIVWGTIPIGSLIGGALGEWLGIEQTLVIGAIGGLFPFLWIFFSPVRQLKEQPAPVDEPETSTVSGTLPVEMVTIEQAEETVQTTSGKE